MGKTLKCPRCHNVLHLARSGTSCRSGAAGSSAPTAAEPERPASPPPGREAEPAPISSTSEERTFAMLCHALGLVSSFVGPLVVWLIKKKDSRFVDYHGREFLNFCINLFGYWVLSMLGSILLSVATCGFGFAVMLPLRLALFGYAVAMMIVASVKAYEGELYRYPLTIRFLPQAEGFAKHETGTPSDMTGSEERRPAGSAARSKGIGWGWIVGGVAVVFLTGLVGAGALIYLGVTAWQTREAEAAQRVRDLVPRSDLGRSARPPGKSAAPPAIPDREPLPVEDQPVRGKAAPSRPAVAPADQLSRDIEDAQSRTNPVARHYALERLKNYDAPVPERQEEVAALLMSNIKGNRDPYLSCMGLVVWATPRELAEMPTYLGHKSLAKAAMKVLGRHKVVSQAETIATYLEQFGFISDDARDALIAMGPGAEKAVIPYLRNSEKGVQKKACYILKVIGGPDSLPALEALTKPAAKPKLSPGQKEIVQAAKLAIQAIEQRQQELHRRENQGHDLPLFAPPGGA
jgi:uncharacterized Tic20 family protein